MTRSLAAPRMNIDTARIGNVRPRANVARPDLLGLREPNQLDNSGAVFLEQRLHLAEGERPREVGVLQA